MNRSATRNVNIINEPPSVTLPRPVRICDHVWSDGTRGSSFDVGPYQVATRPDWHGKEPVYRKFGERYAMLQVCRADGGSVFDWRDLQQIKTMVCGAEWEAVEIFPAESRLRDPSNARYLWCCSSPLPFGLPGGRLFLDAHESVAPQRPLPVDLGEAGDYLPEARS